MKAGDYGDDAIGELGHHARRVDIRDPRLTVHIVGLKRDLPAKPGSGRNTDILQRNRHQAAGHLFARRHNHVVLPRVVQTADLIDLRHQIIGHARHRRQHHGNFIAAVVLRLDASRDMPDALKVADRGAAEFLYNACHRLESVNSLSPPVVPARRRIHTHKVYRVQEHCHGRARTESIMTATENIAQSASVDDSEVAKFAALAESWWDSEGPFRPLHRFNPVRIRFIRDRLASHFNRDPLAPEPLAGLRLLDIGCGGGLLTEPLTRLGATVVGIDATEKNIRIAALHAEQGGLSIDYRHTTAEALDEAGERFDAVLNMEVVEHVADVDAFLTASGNLVGTGGLMIAATLNRTAKSFALAIVGAEYVLRWLPRGTHDWRRFVRPSELAAGLRHAGMTVTSLTGVVFNPLTGIWSLSERDLDVNYMAVAVRNG